MKKIRLGLQAFLLATCLLLFTAGLAGIILLPVVWMVRPVIQEPLPAVLAPQRAGGVTVGLHEAKVLTVDDRQAGNAVGAKRRLLWRQLVIVGDRRVASHPVVSGLLRDCVRDRLRRSKR